jgi:hypothetical protein
MLRNIRPRFVWALYFVLVLLLASSLGGCAALERPEELAWQGMHAYDSLATLDIVDDPCYREGHPETKLLIGDRPTRGAVEGWAVGGALVHAGVSDFLLTHDHPTLYRAWQVVTIADTGLAIHDGLAIGVRVGAPNTRTVANGCH